MKGKGTHQILLIFGIFCVFVILPSGGYGASLTIGDTVSVNGNLNATSFSGDGSGLTGVGGISTCTPITSLPKTITAPGVYCLTSDLTTNVTSGNAIEITTDNVVIDLNGYRLDDLGAGLGTNAIGIHANQRKNITIRNGTVLGFRRGVFLESVSSYTTSQGHIIEDIRADRNTLVGMSIHGRGNVIRNNQVVNTGGATTHTHAYGIEAAGPGNLVLNNDVHETKEQSAAGNAYALLIYEGDGSVVINNRIGNQAFGEGLSYGIVIQSSQNVIVKSNTISIMMWGITFISSTGLYGDNLASGCSHPFEGGTQAGSTNYSN